MKKRVLIASVALALAVTGTAVAAHATQPDNQTTPQSAVHASTTPPTEPEAPASAAEPTAAEPAPTPAPVQPAAKADVEPAPTPVAAPAPAPKPARKLVTATVAYTDSTDYPGQQEAYCTYNFDDGSTEVVWAGRRPTPDTQPGNVQIGCGPWREQ